MSEVTHLSPSGLATWRQCPLKWWHKYVDGWPEYPPSEEMLRGTVVHAAVEALFPVGPVKAPSMGDMDFALSAVWDEADKGPVASDPGEFYDTCRASLHSAVERLSKLDEVLLVEEELRAWKWAGLEFFGFVDMVARKDDKTYVLDLKTGNPPERNTPWYWERVNEKLVQPGLYHAVLSERGFPVDAFGLLFCPHDAPSVLVLNHSSSLEGHSITGGWIGAVGAILCHLEDEELPPPNTGALCGWCPYVYRCAPGEAEVRHRWDLNKSVGPARDLLSLHLDLS